jgi:glycosyltransferase involved in cell wall biosynthesis
MIRQEFSPAHLIVVHYHLRPGGVRRVIELTLPGIVAAMPSIQRVTLMVGESGDANWVDDLRANLPQVDFEVQVHACVGYYSEIGMDAASATAALRVACESVIQLNKETVIWAHNLGLARNLLLARELARIAARPNVRLVSHHHDFWFENRWNRWAEFAACGAISLDAVADDIFSAGARVAYGTINRTDHRALESCRNHAAGWLPNPVTVDRRIATHEVDSVSRWLRSELGDDKPVWVFPSRFLRRKNVVEAMLLIRWMCPDGWLITTAGPSSADEIPAYEIVSKFAARHGFRVRFALLADAGRDAPLIDPLIAACDGVIVTSVQEGFGLPYLEAALAGKPLIARRLPNVFGDLKHLGHSISNGYREVWVHPGLIDIEREIARQRTDWKMRLSGMPAAARNLAGTPWIHGWVDGKPLAFSRLTLAGQLEVLSNDPRESWKVSRRWNPSLGKIKLRMELHQLAPDPVSPTLAHRLSPQIYADAFWHLVKSCAPVSSRDARSTQRAMLADRLADEYLYPVLW